MIALWRGEARAGAGPHIAQLEAEVERLTYALTDQVLLYDDAAKNWKEAERDLSAALDAARTWKAAAKSWRSRHVELLAVKARHPAKKARRVCTTCGCSERNACLVYIAAAGPSGDHVPCWWVSEKTCSACAPLGPPRVRGPLREPVQPSSLHVRHKPKKVKR